MPYTNTSFSQAIFKMFSNLDSWLAEHYNDLPHGAVKVYLFGGCAIHLHTGNRTSNDLDAELEAIKRLQRSDVLIQAVNFEDENGLPSILEFDHNFSITLAPIHPDYKQRATLLTTEFQAVSLYLISAVDIAVSKLGRLGKVDVDDIVNLYQANLFTLPEFLATAETASDYYINPNQLQSNIDYVQSFLD